MQGYTSHNYIKHTHANPLFRALVARFNTCLLAMADAARPQSVLEVGCGEGFVLDYLAERRPNWRLAGCDINAAAIAYARQRCPASIALDVADLYHLPVSSHSIDLVICSEVLEHLADVPAAIAEMQRVSRGQLLITVPHEPLFRVMAGIVVRLGLGLDPEHRQFWTATGFRRLARRHFAEVDFAYSFPYQLALIRAARDSLCTDSAVTSWCHTCEGHGTRIHEGHAKDAEREEREGARSRGCHTCDSRNDACPARIALSPRGVTPAKSMEHEFTKATRRTRSAKNAKGRVTWVSHLRKQVSRVVLVPGFLLSQE